VPNEILPDYVALTPLYFAINTSLIDTISEDFESHVTALFFIFSQDYENNVNQLASTVEETSQNYFHRA